MINYIVEEGDEQFQINDSSSHLVLQKDRDDASPLTTSEQKNGGEKVRRIVGSNRAMVQHEQYEKESEGDKRRSSTDYALLVQKNTEEKVYERRNKRRFGHSVLPLEFWERTEECKEAKKLHMTKVDHFCGGEREGLILKTVLAKADVAIETNMFPYNTPPYIAHYTLWARWDMSHEEVVSFVDEWLHTQVPKCKRWQYDDNMGEKSIELFHVHVYVEEEPNSFHLADPEKEYFPPHVMHMEEMEWMKRFDQKEEDSRRRKRSKSASRW